MSRKIFIDCGFYAGGSLELFKKTPEYSDDFNYFAFDPILRIKENDEKFKHITFIKKAVWNKDGTLSFYTSNRHGGRANGVFHNSRAKKENTITVESIDFSKWIKDNLSKDDYIILKMDIEGAEYDVLPKMIEDGTMNYIDVFYLEWHAKRANDAKYNNAKTIAEQLKNIKGLVVRKSLERYLRSLKTKKV